MCSYFMQDNTTAHTENFSMTVHVAVFGKQEVPSCDLVDLQIWIHMIIIWGMG
jgi:hypothetical protein